MDKHCYLSIKVPLDLQASAGSGNGKPVGLVLDCVTNGVAHIATTSLQVCLLADVVEWRHVAHLLCAACAQHLPIRGLQGSKGGSSSAC